MLAKYGIIGYNSYIKMSSRAESITEKAAPRPDGRVITFYSFEGGTGRTLMATNIGAMLANAGKSVLLADFNFYSPGIHYFKEAKFKHDYCPRGVSGFLADSWYARHSQDVARYAGDILDENWRGTNLLALESNAPGGRLALMPVWSENRELEHDVPKAKEILNMLTDEEKYKEEVLNVLVLLADMRRQWQLNFDYTLIDAPSGFDNIAGVCIRLLADHVVYLSRPAGKGITGTRSVISQVGSESIYGYPLTKTVVASMVEEGQFDRGQFAKQLGLQEEQAQAEIVIAPFDVRMLVDDAPFTRNSFVNTARHLLAHA